MAKRAGKARAARIVIDVLLASCFIAVMATALVAEASREYLGMLLFACMVAHVVLNRRWFLALTRGCYTPDRVLQLGAVAFGIVSFARLGMAGYLSGSVQFAAAETRT